MEHQVIGRTLPFDVLLGRRSIVHHYVWHPVVTYNSRNMPQRGKYHCVKELVGWTIDSGSWWERDIPNRTLMYRLFIPISRPLLEARGGFSRKTTSSTRDSVVDGMAFSRLKAGQLPPACVEGPRVFCL